MTSTAEVVRLSRTGTPTKCGMNIVVACWANDRTAMRVESESFVMNQSWPDVRRARLLSPLGAHTFTSCVKRSLWQSGYRLSGQMLQRC